MAITNHNSKKVDLSHTTEVKVDNQVSRDEIVTENPTITFPANIRVDNHIRNKITAMINLGIEDNAKATVEHLIVEEEEKLSDSDRLRYERMVNILEQKDYMTKALKVKK